MSAALCCGIAAALAVHALRPPPPSTTAVVVAARPLAAGTLLSADDLRVALLPQGLVPVGAASTESAVIGTTAGIEIPTGLPLVNTLTRNSTSIGAAPAGTVVAPVRLDPLVATMLTPGDRIDLLRSSGSQTSPGADESDGSGDPLPGSPHPGPYLARSAVVVPSPDLPDGGFLGGTGSSSGVVLVAVLPEEAEHLAAHSDWNEIAAILVP